MFYDLFRRNSRRSRKENGLFFVSLLISIIAFYIILALPGQDVMIFLKEMESDAVARLMTLIPVFYAVTLVILFFLIYFTCKFQMQRRRREFGIYLMMGMRRGRLFFLLLLEDLYSTGTALLIGLPSGILLSELISLITARVVGLDILKHTFSLSISAVCWTAAGFLAIKLMAFLILSGRISRQEIGELLSEIPEGTKKQRPAPVYVLSLGLGILSLGTAYSAAVSGTAWQKIGWMACTVFLGVAGTFLLYYGLRTVIGTFAKRGKQRKELSVFNFRQIQENVICQSAAMAVSSLLITAALCCFGAGTGIAGFYGNSEPHVLDYTFYDYMSENGLEKSYVRNVLEKSRLEKAFSKLFEMKIGPVRTTDDYENILKMDSVIKAALEFPESEGKEILLNKLEFADYPYLISLSGYNELLETAGLEKIVLESDETAVYIDPEMAEEKSVGMLNQILESRPEVFLDGAPFHMTGEVQTTAVVTDRSITLDFALIVPDKVFDFYTEKEYEVYVNGVLDSRITESQGLMRAVSSVNEKLDKTGIVYESYLQNMGRELFYMVAASYITIYLAVIFLIVANTVMGVQFLMNQQKTNSRYRTLVRLGAVYETICRSAGKQINWFFGIPVAVGAVNSLVGVRALFSGILSSRTQGDMAEMLIVSVAMILLLGVVEYIYISAVKKMSRRYLLTLMVPEREE